MNTQPTFTNGQRVKILPCKNYPPTKKAGGIRYGIIQGMTDKEGMHLQNEPRTNKQGEWAYIVASYYSPKAGAAWFTESGLKPMKNNH